MQQSEDLRNQYRFVYESVSKKLAAQLVRLQTIDTKATIILAALGVVLVGLFQLIVAEKLTFREFKPLIVAEFILFLVAGTLIFKAFLLRKNEYWRDDPNPTKLHALFTTNWQRGESWLTEKTIEAMAESYESNANQIKIKHRYLRYGSLAFCLGIVVLLLHLVAMLYDIREIVIPLT